jgi:hypothetical protein
MDQLETLIERFEMLIAYQCIDLPDNIAILKLSRLYPLPSHTIACNNARDGQHGNCLGRTVTQSLGAGQRIQ